MRIMDVDTSLHFLEEAVSDERSFHGRKQRRTTWERVMDTTARPSNRIRILVVEDEAVTRHALCQVLHRSGYFCAGASDGTQAIDMVKYFKPQAIIMDLKLPRLDGFETTRRLKADDVTQSIPILALTGSADPDVQNKALQAGVDIFLMKPINLDELLLHLRRRVPDQEPPSDLGGPMPSWIGERHTSLDSQLAGVPTESQTEGSRSQQILPLENGKL